MIKYIQIGVTALRDSVTGNYYPAAPLYIRADDSDKKLEEDFSKFLFNRIEQFKTKRDDSDAAN